MTNRSFAATESPTRILAALVVLFFSSATANATMPADRNPEPIVLAGELFGVELEGRPIEQLVLLAKSEVDGLLRPIPFQIDERDPSGEYALAAGPAASDDTDARRFDRNDELVFLARDAGARADAVLPDADMVVEIRLSDPSVDATAWVYLAAFESSPPPPLSPRRYIEFDAENETVTTAAYHLRFTDPARPFTVTWTSIPRPDGSVGIDFMDSVRVRLTGRFLGLKRVTRTDRDFESKNLGYIAGPVRVIRVIDSRLRLVAGISAPGAKVVRVYYPDWIESPIPISLPFRIGALFADTQVFFGADYDLPVDGSHRYYSDLFPNGLPIGGLAEGLDVAGPPPVPIDTVRWHGVAGPVGAVLSAVRLPSTVPVTAETVYELGSTIDLLEEVPGSAPLVGTRLVDWEKVRRGRHVAYFYDFFPGNYQPGDERSFLQMLGQPVEATISPAEIRITASPEPDGVIAHGLP
jgi:hypothetical protein